MSDPATPIARALTTGLVPFAFGAPDNLAALDLAPLGVPLRPIDATDPASTPFHRALNRLNHAAFGGLGMPAWVQLDLGVLPSAFIGWAVAPEALPDTLRSVLVGDASGDGAVGPLIPVAEVLAVPTWTPGRVTSVSMASLWPGLGLGALAKALGLGAMRATEAIGVTQLDNPAVRSHTRLGRMEILRADVAYHDLPSVVYRLRVDPARLRGVLDGASPPDPAPDAWLPVDAARAWLRGGGAVVSPGHRLGPAGVELALSRA